MGGRRVGVRGGARTDEGRWSRRRGRLDVGDHASGDSPLYTTTITVGELAFGASRSTDEAGNLAAVRTLLDGLTVLPFDTVAAFVYGRLRADLWRKGQPIGDPDLLIASIANAHGLTLATHNRRHFDRIPGLRTTDWLTSPPPVPADE